MENFFQKKSCDRCGASLENQARIMSMFNMDVLCLKCKEAEKKSPAYKQAVEADLAEIKRGNYNFPGING